MDIRELFFDKINNNSYKALLTPEADGIISGVKEAKTMAKTLGVDLKIQVNNGDPLEKGIVFASMIGAPVKIAMAEEKIIGTIAKASGIATAARKAVKIANGRVSIVSGSWKKMPPDIKQLVRNAIETGGASFRICEPPMLYIDKNFIRMLGSIAKALNAAKQFTNITKVVQLRGEKYSIREETHQAVDGGADILMVDTGDKFDMLECLEELKKMNQRENVKVAFAGNVNFDEIDEMVSYGIDILCIGKKIVDAGLLDMKLDVVEEVKK